jgi:hypothetical protein
VVSNPGIASIKVAVSYDANKLKLKSVENGEIFADGDFQGSEFITDNPYILLYVDGVNPDTTATGVLAYLVFEVAEGYTGTVPVEIGVSGIVNSDLSPVVVEEEKAGSVVVTETTAATETTTVAGTDETTAEAGSTTEAEAVDATTTAAEGEGNGTGDTAPVVPFAVAVVLMGAAVVCVKKFGLN